MSTEECVSIISVLDRQSRLFEQCYDQFGLDAASMLSNSTKSIREIIRRLNKITIDGFIINAMTFHPDLDLDKITGSQYGRLEKRVLSAALVNRQPKVCPRCGCVLASEANEIWVES